MEDEEEPAKSGLAVTRQNEKSGGSGIEEDDRRMARSNEKRGGR